MPVYFFTALYSKTLSGFYSTVLVPQCTIRVVYSSLRNSLRFGEGPWEGWSLGREGKTTGMCGYS